MNATSGARKCDQASVVGGGSVDGRNGSRSKFGLNIYHTTRGCCNIFSAVFTLTISNGHWIVAEQMHAKQGLSVTGFFLYCVTLNIMVLVFNVFPRSILTFVVPDDMRLWHKSIFIGYEFK